MAPRARLRRLAEHITSPVAAEVTTELAYPHAALDRESLSASRPPQPPLFLARGAGAGGEHAAARSRDVSSEALMNTPSDRQLTATCLHP